MLKHIRVLLPSLPLLYVAAAPIVALAANTRHGRFVRIDRMCMLWRSMLLRRVERTPGFLGALQIAGLQGNTLDCFSLSNARFLTNRRAMTRSKLRAVRESSR